MTEIILAYLSGLPPELIVLIIAALPIIELRGAIPVGIFLLRLPPWEVFLLAMVGNIAPIPVLLMILGPLRRHATHWPLIGPLLRWAEGRAQKRRRLVEVYGFWGLILFVGVPLPFTGAWTGSLVAVILALSPWRALVAIAIGIVTAGTAIALLSSAGLHVMG